MPGEKTSYRGCLLGLAVGDAMGYTVDDRNWEEIRRDYGPNGLLGYDLVNGYADVTSHTQLAAFTCNALLLALTQGQLRGKISPYVRYIRLGEREWAAVQHRQTGGRKFCWVARRRELQGRRCMDTRMLDAIARERFGSMEEPENRFNTPNALTTAVPVGLFRNPERMASGENRRLGAEAVALTHGSALSFLSGSLIAGIISSIVWEQRRDLPTVIENSLSAVEKQFSREYPQGVEQLKRWVHTACSLSQNTALMAADAMEQLSCRESHEVLAGALYACLTCRGDFDTAMITAVNHSGRSAAVGALTGAILGAILGEEELPEFYLESLEPVDVLRELADDLYTGCPLLAKGGIFDDDWDDKYVQCRR